MHVPRQLRSIYMHTCAMAIITGSLFLRSRESFASRDNRADSGMHVVGLYQATDTSHFYLVDAHARGIDWERFRAVLIASADSDVVAPPKRLWEALPQRARNVILDEKLIQRIVASVEKPEIAPEVEVFRAYNDVQDGLRDMLSRRDFFDEKAHDKVPLSADGKELLKRRDKLSLLELALLNRRLFEASFPGIVKASKFNLEKATVPVRVKATREPITLVLCSSHSVRWSIQEEKGAKIAKVLVGGYYLQAVTGTEAPVSYWVYESPDRPKQPPTNFYAYDPKDKQKLSQLADTLRMLTGKEIETFQGRSTYAGGPAFVVGGTK